MITKEGEYIFESRKILWLWIEQKQIVFFSRKIVENMKDDQIVSIWNDYTLRKKKNLTTQKETGGKHINTPMKPHRNEEYASDWHSKEHRRMIIFSSNKCNN